MKRRSFIAAVGAMVAWPVVVRAQQPAGKVPQIGYLGVASASDGARGAARRMVAGCARSKAKIMLTNMHKTYAHPFNGT